MLCLPATPQVVGQCLLTHTVGSGQAEVAPRAQFAHIAVAIRELGICQTVGGVGWTDESNMSLGGGRDFADGYGAVEWSNNGSNLRIASDVAKILALAAQVDGTTIPTNAATATNQ